MLTWIIGIAIFVVAVVLIVVIVNMQNDKPQQ